jgi:hypothetical protein
MDQPLLPWSGGNEDTLNVAEEAVLTQWFWTLVPVFNVL